MSSKIKKGKEGEQLAANFLIGKGFEVVAKNYRHRHAEIDLIVKRDDWLIFVEVKARSSSDFGEPEEFVDLRKINKIFEAAEEYIFSTDWQGHIRFDIVSIKLGREPVIELFEDAIN
ncbi:MAG TPA: YraN family protein [Ohtaekwangia sp.]|uniref:YraN family protein n=1 Tax=Ohtaekwangia sp. TaxID=2066019 RepID=UPI002F925AEC